MSTHPILFLAQWFAILIISGVTLTALYDLIETRYIKTRNSRLGKIAPHPRATHRRPPQFKAHLIYSRRHYYQRSRL
jgi:hypothetical protein